MAAFNWYSGSPLSQKSCMTKPVPLCGLANLQLRFLCPSDLEEVRALCQDWFPIDYPHSWYEDITSDPRFYALAAVLEGAIIGLVVAELRPFTKLSREDRGILSVSGCKHAEVGYILSLGVSKPHRRNGIASLLLDNLINHLTSADHAAGCKAVFLHVLTTNTAAIRFYEHRHFRLHSFLPYYYSIKGKCKDGFTYVLYINGGHPPWGLFDYVKHYVGWAGERLSQPCRLPQWLWAKLQAVAQWAWPGLRRVAAHNTS